MECSGTAGEEKSLILESPATEMGCRNALAVEWEWVDNRSIAVVVDPIRN